MSTGPFRVLAGEPFPAGASVSPKGVNFAVFSRNATAVSLRALRDARGSASRSQVIELDPVQNSTFFFWHVLVDGARPGSWYTWRVDGPGDTARTGFRFDPRRELLDPWARAVSDELWNRAAPRGSRCAERRHFAPGSSATTYDWEGDAPLNHRLEDSIIYEMHVGGFTRHPSARVTAPGTFGAVIEKIPYLQSLGITDVELMPVMAFDPQDVPAGDRRARAHATTGATAPTASSRRIRPIA